MRTWLAGQDGCTGRIGAKDRSNRGTAEKLERTLAAVAGPSDYDEPSAQDARRRIVSFFDRHLRPGG